MQQSIEERIKELLKTKRYSINSLAKETGIVQQTLNKQIMGSSTIPVDTITKILDLFPDVSAEWLLRGEGYMTKLSQHNVNGDNIGGNKTVVDTQLIEQLKIKDNQINELLSILKNK